MSNETPRTIPEPSLRRFPIYLLYLQDLNAQTVSCSRISEDLRLDASQIRKDFEIVGISGKPRVGYSVPELLRHVQNVIGWNEPRPAVLAGAGPLGRAILSCLEIRKSGLRITAVFDSDDARIGETAEGLEVMPLGFLPDVVRRTRAGLGIVAMPAAAAQNAADMMIAAGVKAIWNFCPAVLRTPPEVVVHYSDFSTSLAGLTARLAGRSCPRRR